MRVLNQKQVFRLLKDLQISSGRGYRLRQLMGFDPAEDHIGPFYSKEMGDRRLYAFKVEEKHCNVTAILHGGVLMTFADYCLSMEATNNYKEEDCVTVSFNCEFVSGAAKGDLVECRTNVTRKTGSLAFIVGEIFY